MFPEQLIYSLVNLALVSIPGVGAVVKPWFPIHSLYINKSAWDCKRGMVSKVYAISPRIAWGDHGQKLSEVVNVQSKTPQFGHFILFFRGTTRQDHRKYRATSLFVTVDCYRFLFIKKGAVLG